MPFWGFGALSRLVLGVRSSFQALFGGLELFPGSFWGFGALFRLFLEVRSSFQALFGNAWERRGLVRVWVLFQEGVLIPWALLYVTEEPQHIVLSTPFNKEAKDEEHRVEVVLRNPKMAIAILAQGESLDTRELPWDQPSDTISKKVHARGKRPSVARTTDTLCDYVDTLVVLDLQGTCASL